MKARDLIQHVDHSQQLQYNFDSTNGNNEIPEVHLMLLYLDNYNHIAHQ